MNSMIRRTVKGTLSAALFSVATAALANQPLPATQHQADVIEDVQRKQTQPAESSMKLPASEHQEQVLREFEQADKNRDGMLTKAEYAAYVVHNTAARYNAGLSAPEKPGVDAAGPRDRHAAENSRHPLPSGDPTVTD